MSLATAHADRRTVDLNGLAKQAARLAATLAVGDVVALWGDLGAGKTTFARQVIQARAAASGLTISEVPSPTFTLVQVYEIPDGDIWHLDLYRLPGPGSDVGDESGDVGADEALELGIEEAFASAISLIEWPGRLGHHLPEQRLDVCLADGPSADLRTIELTDNRSGWPRRKANG